MWPVNIRIIFSFFTLYPPSGEYFGESVVGGSCSFINILCRNFFSDVMLTRLYKPKNNFPLFLVYPVLSLIDYKMLEEGHNKY